MGPELKVFATAGAVMAFAYIALYPPLQTKTFIRLMQLDLAVTGALLAVVGAVYYGTDTPFSLVLFTVPWWLFTLLSAAVVEAPLFWWFCKRWNIDLNPPME